MRLRLRLRCDAVRCGDGSLLCAWRSGSIIYIQARVLTIRDSRLTALNFDCNFGHELLCLLLPAQSVAFIYPLQLLRLTHALHCINILAISSFSARQSQRPCCAYSSSAPTLPGHDHLVTRKNRAQRTAVIRLHLLCPHRSARTPSTTEIVSLCERTCLEQPSLWLKAC